MLSVMLAAALACPSAPSGTRVPISVARDDRATTTALRLCGHTLARGKMGNHRPEAGRRIGAASAAGHHVAWIEERRRGRERTSVVTLARVGREVRVLRRFTVQRARTIFDASLGVVLTREGDLAWASSTVGGATGVVAVAQPGKRVRRLSRSWTYRLALEDGRTLRWDQGEGSYEYFDLRRRRCPGGRARFKPYAGNDRVILTAAQYHPTLGEGTTVVRGCDPATGRDRVLARSYHDITIEGDLRLVGLDRSWAVFAQSEYFPRYDDSYSATLTAIDVVSGRSRSADTSKGDVPPPSAAVVTDAGVAAWISGQVLYALVDYGKIVRLDEGATLEGLHAEGKDLTWTHDGAPHRITP